MISKGEFDDGVHPTPAGHAVLADCWLETVLGNE